MEECEKLEISAISREASKELTTTSDTSFKSLFPKRKSDYILYYISGVTMANYPSLIGIEKELMPDKADIDLLISPFIWGTLSDNYGRRPSFLMLIISTLLGCLGFAIAEEKWQLILGKILQELGISGAFICGFGVVADLYSPIRRGNATGVYMFMPSISTSLAPLLVGFVVEYGHWRYSYFIAAGLVFLFLMGCYFLPETLRQPKLAPPIQFSRTEKTKFNRIANPFVILTILKKPIVLLTLLSSCLMFVPVICIVSIYPVLIAEKYELNSVQLGLCLIVNGVADSLGGFIGGKLADYYIRPEGEINKAPENRLKSLYIGVPLVICGVVTQGIIMKFQLNIAVLLCSTFLICIGLNISLISTISYMIDLFPINSSQVFGTNVFVRFTISSIAVSFNSKFMKFIGMSAYYYLSAALSLLSLFVAVFIQLKGKNIR